MSGLELEEEILTGAGPSRFLGLQKGTVINKARGLVVLDIGVRDFPSKLSTSSLQFQRGKQRLVSLGTNG